MGIFVDDRLIWAKGNNEVSKVRDALKIALEYDTKCGREWNKGKGICFVTDGNQAATARRQLKDAGGLVIYLGVEYAVDSMRRR